MIVILFHFDWKERNLKAIIYCSNATMTLFIFSRSLFYEGFLFPPPRV